MTEGEIEWRCLSCGLIVLMEAVVEGEVVPKPFYACRCGVAQPSVFLPSGVLLVRDENEENKQR